MAGDYSQCEKGRLESGPQVANLPHRCMLYLCGFLGFFRCGSTFPTT